MPYTKALKIGKALKSAARLPSSPASRKLGFKSDRPYKVWGRRNTLTPNPDEQPVLILKVQVIGCQSIRAGDSNGYSDPFVSLSLLNTRFTTPVVKKTLNPVWNPKDATFQFPLYLSLADRMGALEIIVWDKDALKKEYLGEVALQVEDWFGKRGDGFSSLGDAVWAFDDPENEPITLPIVSTRENVAPSGSIQLKIGFIAPDSTASDPAAFQTVYKQLVKRSRPSIVSAPPTEGIGTIRSHHQLSGFLATSSAADQPPDQSADFYEDDGGLSSSSSSEDEDDDYDDDFLDQDDSAPSSAAVTAPASPSPISSPAKPAAQPGSRDANVQGSTSLANTPVELSVPPATPVNPATSAPKVGLFQRFKRKSMTPRTGTTSASTSPQSGDSHALPVDATGQANLAAGASAGVGLGLSGLEDEGKAKPERKGMFSRKSWNTSHSSSKEIKDASGKSTTVAFNALSTSPTTSPRVVPDDSSPGTSSTIDEDDDEDKEKAKKKKKKAKSKGEYRLGGGKDIVGIVMLEVHGATNLPKLTNMTRTGWDMDPFVVISFGKKVFRTRVLRHSLNPVWDEKLLFHVRRYETSFKVNLSVLDWDKLSSNDNIGDASFDVKELLENALQPDPVTGLYKSDDDGAQLGQVQDSDMKEYTLSLTTEKGIAKEAKNAPMISFRAKYQPYAALRQRFWRQYLKQYDSEDVGKLSHLELTSMLDSLGSTLTRETVNSFWTKFGKKVDEDTLTTDEAVMCLEEELTRPDSEKRRIKKQEYDDDSSISATPILGASDREGKPLPLEGLDFSGPNVAGVNTILGREHYRTEPSQMPLEDVAIKSERKQTIDNSGEEGEDEGDSSDFVSASEDVEKTSGAKPGRSMTQATVAPLSSASSSPLDTSAAESSSGGGGGGKRIRFGAGIRKRKEKRAGTKDLLVPKKPKKTKSKDKEFESSSGSGSSAETGTDDGSIERVINVKSCPLCHRPRMHDKAGVDIITHLAVCASKDWNKVDKIVVGNFVTASQAQRKWYTKVLTKISSGDYKLGANSANIIVQNRMTGQLEEEKMQVYVRLGIRLLYKGATGRMESGKARSLLKSLSIKQGIKYDAPESARDIPGFIEFHKLDVNEIQDPLDSFKNFNEFFYRKLKASARPVEMPDDPYRLVSAADCRFMGFETVSDASRIWIKGREFSVANLLGATYKDDFDRYHGGALAIFRLAPQDYHRFHSPVDGRIGKMTYIAGEYYTVNPQAIRTALDVYGENVRKIVPIDSPQFGRVMAVCVGAMMVGTIKTTVDEGQLVKRGEEFGYFAFGGSTIVVLFEKDMVEWDEDLLLNGRSSLETLVRVGMGIGKGHNPN